MEETVEGIRLGRLKEWDSPPQFCLLLLMDNAHLKGVKNPIQP